MSALYVIVGVLLGVLCAHINAAEPFWALLLIPAGAVLGLAIATDRGN